jgi:hypothetical protein
MLLPVRFNDLVGWDPVRDGSEPPWPYQAPFDGYLGEQPRSGPVARS